MELLLVIGIESAHDYTMEINLLTVSGTAKSGETQ